MSEESVTDHQPGTTGTTNTTIIREKSSSTGIIMALILLIAVVGGIYLFSQNSTSETAKNDAVAEAAKDVGNAATKVGDAAEDAVNESK